MRTIKFRAWDMQDKVMHPDVIVVSNLFIVLQYTIDDNNDLENTYIKYDNSDGQVIPMQYTGLKDKNGKEIYEGDIVMENPDGVDVIGKVEFIDGVFSVNYTDRKSQSRKLGRYGLGERLKHYELEVIGDIYNNPELLKP